MAKAMKTAKVMVETLKTRGDIEAWAKEQEAKAKAAAERGAHAEAEQWRLQAAIARRLAA